MQNKRKTIRQIFWIVVLAGSALLGGCSAAFHWKTTLSSVLFVLWLVLLSVVSLVIDIVWYRTLGKQVNDLLPLLRTDPDAYITELRTLLGGSKSPALVQTMSINLAAAYCEKADYAQAAGLLEGLDLKKLAPANQPIYWADLALIRFHLGQDEEAVSILDAREALFSPHREGKRLGGLLAVLEIFRALAQGEEARARQLLTEARTAWPDALTQKELDGLEARINA